MCGLVSLAPMSSPNGKKRAGKLSLHPRNPHRARYDFALLSDSSPELAQYVRPNRYGSDSIDFADPDAVKALNRALLNHFYGVTFWDIPAGFLCPPIPGRADYIHYLADLLAESNGGMVPRGKSVRALDIGTGANCVYPIIGHREYGWRFVGTDVNPVAVKTASTIVSANSGLSGGIECRLQANAQHLFQGIWGDQERFDVTLCNPPFHTSEREMKSGSERKWRGLGKGKPARESGLNFGGQASELWCEGGEQAFVCRMVRESQHFAERCFWFTSLVAKQDSLPAIYRELKQVGAELVRTVDMAQGQKVSRFVAWTFLQPDQRDYWQDTYWN